MRSGHFEAIWSSLAPLLAKLAYCPEGFLGPPADYTEKGPRESATRIFRECPPRTFEKFRLRGTIPRLTTVPRNHSAANNRAAEPFRGRQLCRGLIPPTLRNEL